MSRTGAREALQEMVWQFAVRSKVDGRKCLTTGGLSALEAAFDALGWDDPHFLQEDDVCGCEIAGCPEWPTCVGAYPRSLAAGPAGTGFGYLCGKHYHRWNSNNPKTAPDLGRQAMT